MQRLQYGKAGIIYGWYVPLACRAPLFSCNHPAFHVRLPPPPSMRWTATPLRAAQVKWNRNGHWLLSCSRDQLVKLYDVRMLKEVASFAGHGRDVACVAWHPQHEELFVSGAGAGAGAGCRCAPLARP